MDSQDVVNAIYRVYGCRQAVVALDGGAEAGGVSVQVWRVALTDSAGETVDGIATSSGDQVWLHTPDGTQASHIA